MIPLLVHCAFCDAACPELWGQLHYSDGVGTGCCVGFTGVSNKFKEYF